MKMKWTDLNWDHEKPKENQAIVTWTCDSTEEQIQPAPNELLVSWENKDERKIVQQLDIERKTDKTYSEKHNQKWASEHLKFSLVKGENKIIVSVKSEEEKTPIKELVEKFLTRSYD